MYPRLGSIPTCGILYGMGIVSYFVIGYLIAKRLGLQHRVWIAAGVCYNIGMIVGAKVLYDVQHGGFSLVALLSVKHYISGGLWGGLLAYLVLAVPLVLVLTRRRRAALDLLAMAVPTPWIFAKVGCLLNGCCYGKPCSLPWAITFPEVSRGAPPGVPIHPTQIYEILVMVLALAAFKVLQSDRWRGTMLFWFLAIYGLGRAVTEIWRGDKDQQSLVGPFSLSQLICLVVAVLSIAGLYLWRRYSIGTSQHAGLHRDNLLR